MKGNIQTKYTTQILMFYRVSVVAVYILKFFDHFGRGRQRNGRCARQFENFTYGVQVLDFFGGIGFNERPTIFDAFNQADTFELEQCLTDNVAFAVKALNQVFLDQSFFGVKASQHYVFFYSSDDVIDTEW